MSSASATQQHQKDASSSGSAQLSTSSVASGNNATSSSTRADEKSSSSLGKRHRGARAGTKRRLEGGGQKSRQLIRYDRDTLLQLRDSRLSAAWPRALDKAFLGDGGLWDPVKLFEGEKKVVIEGKPKIERVSRNVRVAQPYNNPPLGSEDGHSFGRSSRRRKRTKDEAPLMVGPQKQRGGGDHRASGAWQQQQVPSVIAPQPTASGPSHAGQQSQLESNSSRSKSESEKENKKEPQPLPPPQQQQQLPPRLGSAAANAAAAGSGGRSRWSAGTGVGRGPGNFGTWERSQGPRDHYQQQQQQRYGRTGVPSADTAGPAGIDDEELPAWFDEGPLDKMEKLELTGLPEDMEASDECPQQPPGSSAAYREQQKPAHGAGRGAGHSSSSSSSRFSKWLAAEPPAGAEQHQQAKTSGPQQQLERIFQDLRVRRPQEYPAKQPDASYSPGPSATGPSLMHLLRPASPSQSAVAQQQQQQQTAATSRPLHAQEVEASLKSMLFGGSATAAQVSVASAKTAATVANGASGKSAMPVLPPTAHARTLEEIESSLGAAGSSDRGSRGSGAHNHHHHHQQQPSTQDSRAIYKLIGELQLQMHEADASAGSSAAASAVAAAGSSGRQSADHHQQLQQSLLSGSDVGRHSQQQRQQQLMNSRVSQGNSQQQQVSTQPPPPPTPPFSAFTASAASGTAPVFSSAAAAAAAAAAAQRRLPMPLQAQHLQQLHAMLLSNLQLQAQMMHNGQLSNNSTKAHPLNKLLPQPFVYRPPNPFLIRNNALQGKRLLNLNQQLNLATSVAGGAMSAVEFAGFEPGSATAAAAAAAIAGGNGNGRSAAHQPQIAQPAMPIVPPMLLPPKTGGTSASSAAAAAAAAAGWGGAHHSHGQQQQLNAMLWNATKLAASVKSSAGGGNGAHHSAVGGGAGASAWAGAIHRDQQVVGVAQPPPPSKASVVDEVPSA